MNLTDEQRNARDKALKVNGYCGGIANFSHVDSTMLRLAIANEWIDGEEEQGCGTTTNSYLEFLEENPRFRAHGYVVTNRRPDCRMYISGVILNNGEPTKKEILAFVENFKDSEQFVCNEESLYCND